MKESEENLISDPYASDEIDLGEIFGVLWESKKLIILITSVVAICSIVYSLTLPNYYSSESVLIARDSQNSSTLSQYSGLASLAGVDLPSSGDTAVFEVMEIIKSREFVKHLITFENVLPSIMAAKSYDAASQELYFDPKIYNVKTKTWIREPSKNKGSKPSYIEAHKEYHSLLSISQDAKTGLVSIMVEHISPIFAKDFLTLIIKEANTLNRDIDIDTSNYTGYNISCHGEDDGWIDAHVSGGIIPYTYQWNTGSTSDSVYNLIAGEYYLVVTDDNGCSSDPDTINLIEPPTSVVANIYDTTDYNGFHISCFNATDGSIKVNASGGVPGYTYSWRVNGQLMNEYTDSIVNVPAGDYWVEII